MQTLTATGSRVLHASPKEVCEEMHRSRRIFSINENFNFNLPLLSLLPVRACVFYPATSALMVREPHCLESAVVAVSLVPFSPLRKKRFRKLRHTICAIVANFNATCILSSSVRAHKKKNTPRRVAIKHSTRHLKLKADPSWWWSLYRPWFAWGKVVSSWRCECNHLHLETNEGLLRVRFCGIVSLFLSAVGQSLVFGVKMCMFFFLRRGNSVRVRARNRFLYSVPSVTYSI